MSDLVSVACTLDNILSFASVLHDLLYAVGCALAGLVLMVLVAYLVGEIKKIEDKILLVITTIPLFRSKKESRKRLPECLRGREGGGLAIITVSDICWALL